MTVDPDGYYSELGISPSASTQEIKAVYRALAKIYHPDANKDRAASDKFRRLTQAYETLSDPNLRATYDARGDRTSGSQNPSPAPSRPTSVDPVHCSSCGRATAQPRFLTFRQVYSFILATQVSPKVGIFCSDCASRQAIRSSAISATFGWWGVPWGPIFTIREILRNAFGGERHLDIDEELAWQNALAFTERGQYELAASLASRLQAASNSQINAAARQLLKLFSDNGVKVSNLKSPWTNSSPRVILQIAMGCVVPFSIYFLLADPLDFSGRARFDSLSAVPPQTSSFSVPSPTASDISSDQPSITTQIEDLCGDRPNNGKILKRISKNNQFGHRLTIKNGSTSDAIIKLRDAKRRTLSVSFFVQKNKNASIEGIPDGIYRIQFAFGDAMSRDCESFIQPSASEFDTTQDLRTRTTETQIITHDLSLTLYTVPGGNVRQTRIDQKAFEEN